jgi:hypothetical protein
MAASSPTPPASSSIAEFAVGQSRKSSVDRATCPALSSARPQSEEITGRGYEGTGRCALPVLEDASGRYPFLNPVPFEEILPDERIMGH